MSDITKSINSEIKNLAVKKNRKINLNGNKVKVVRNGETDFTIYRDGYFVQTVETAEEVFSFTLALLELSGE
jgi:hypothetical protein